MYLKIVRLSRLLPLRDFISNLHRTVSNSPLQLTPQHNTPYIERKEIFSRCFSANLFHPRYPSAFAHSNSSVIDDSHPGCAPRFHHFFSYPSPTFTRSTWHTWLMQRTCTTYNALDLRIYNLVCIPVWPAFFTLAFVPNSKINTRFHDVMQRRAVDNFVCSSIEIMPVIAGSSGRRFISTFCVVYRWRSIRSIRSKGWRYRLAWRNSGNRSRYCNRCLLASSIIFFDLFFLFFFFLCCRKL